MHAVYRALIVASWGRGCSEKDRYHIVRTGRLTQGCGDSPGGEEEAGHLLVLAGHTLVINAHNVHCGVVRWVNHALIT